MDLNRDEIIGIIDQHVNSKYVRTGECMRVHQDMEDDMKRVEDSVASINKRIVVGAALLAVAQIAVGIFG